MDRIVSVILPELVLCQFQADEHRKYIPAAFYCLLEVFSPNKHSYLSQLFTCAMQQCTDDRLITAEWQPEREQVLRAGVPSP